MSATVALVTGGATGIGREVARLWAALGHHVVIADIDAAAAQVAADELLMQGLRASAVATDVGSESSCLSLFEQIARQHGRLDLALNNAGIAGPAAKVGDVDEAGWRRTMEVNLFGVMRCLAAELRLFEAQGTGSVVNVASVYGKRGVAGGSAYAASKHAILGLTRSAALEYGRLGIRVNAVCPGFIETAFTCGADSVVPSKVIDRQVQRTAARRLGQAQEVAQAVVWLASDAASYMNGAAMDIDGGFLAA